MNTSCTFLGCPIVAQAQRLSQAVRKHHHLPDGSIPFSRNGTRAYIRLSQGRWTLVAPKGQHETMHTVQAPQQFALASPPQHPATGQHLAPFLPQQQQTRMAAPPYIQYPRAPIPTYNPIPALAPTPRPYNTPNIRLNPSVRRMASDTLTPPHTKKAKLAHPSPSTAKQTLPLNKTTPRHILPIPPLTTTMIAQERAQQELRYASQQAKENRVNNPQQDLTPSSGVRRQNPKKTTVKATGMPVAEKTPVRPAEEIAVHSMQSQTPEALHEHRVKDWWFTNPYGDQSQLYLPGSGVPPGVKLCHEGECVACEKTEA